jgi:prevent-host-death family protein
MATKARSIAVREFESECLSLVEQVAATGEPVILTKAGEPIAKLVPFKKPTSLLGSVVWEGDIVSPVGESWDAES